MIKDILKRLFQYNTLTQEEAKEILTNITQEKYAPAEVAAFLTVYMMRTVTVAELSGFRDALLNLCRPINLSEFNTIDLCGTGGDGKDTFNISTLASIVVAGAGVKVAKHGNYSSSSHCGSSNVLEYFGYKFTDNRDTLRNQLDKAGICYLHAPLFHPAMKAVGPIRRELGLKTFFNMLGPMVNPSSPQNQLVGVFNLEAARLYNYIYQDSGKNYVILHSLDGYDEISLTSDFKAITNNGEHLYSPEKIGLTTISQESILGGKTVEDAANIFKSVLDGNGTEAQNNVVIANAAMAINTSLPEKSIAQCIKEAKKSLLDGKAKNVLETLLQLQ